MRTVKLTPFQIMTLTATTIFSIDIDRILSKTAAENGLISIILGELLALFASLLPYWLAKMYPDSDLPEILIQVFGKVMGRIILVPIILFFLVNITLIIRIFADITKVYLLNRTPYYAIILFMLATVISVVKRGIYCMAGVTDISSPLFLIATLVIFLMGFKDIDMENLGFLIADSSHPLKGILPGYSAFIGYSVILYIFRYAPNHKRILKWYLGGVLIPIFFFTMFTILCSLILSPAEMKTAMYPILELVSSIEVPATFLERLELLVLIFWIPLICNVLSMYCFVSVRNISTLFKTKTSHEKYIAYSIIPIITALALYINNVHESMDYFYYTQYFAIFPSISLIVMMLGVTTFKRRRSHKK